MTQILLHADAWARIKDHIDAQVTPVTPILLKDDGSLWQAGQQVDVDNLEIEVAWMSNDLFRPGQAGRVFGVAVLKSKTMKWLQTASAGLDNDFFKSVMDKGIRLTNSDAQARAIAEFVIAQVLAHYHPTEARREAQRSGEWQRLGFREIYQTRWTIVGFGNIGSEIGKRARGFDAHVTGLRRTPGPHEHADTMGTLEDLPQLLPTSDVVVLACPLNEATRGLVDETFLNAMKDGATLVNIGRGDLVDEPALLQGLDRGKPDFAILDVFATEPLPQDHALWAHERVAISAHTSAFGSGTGQRGDALFIENFKRLAAGEPLRNEVDISNYDT